jgi:hypothetical protein
MQSMGERNRNNRIKELMAKKNDPLLVIEDDKKSVWNVNKVLEDRDRIIDFAIQQKEERKDYWKDLNSRYY